MMPSFSPSRRITVEEALDHPYLEVRDCQDEDRTDPRSLTMTHRTNRPPTLSHPISSILIIDRISVGSNLSVSLPTQRGRLSRAEGLEQG